MNAWVNRVQADRKIVLPGVLERARQSSSSGVVAFDLDSTLFDNRPRQARIFREFGAARGLAPLQSCRPDYFKSWDLRASLAECGLETKMIEVVFADLKRFWQERFFTSEYCIEDVSVPGAPAYVRAVAETGARLCYVTGRHEGMRPGTLESFRRWGMVLPNGSPNAQLIMKPNPEMGDDEFKRQAHRQLSKLGTVVAVFDNEPAHINDYRLTFPTATVVHLATDHSGRAIELLEGIPSIPNFELAN